VVLEASEGKIAPANLGKASHISGIGVVQAGDGGADLFAGLGIAFLNPAEPFPSVLQTSSGRC
jgi:hypothetical protein